MGNVLLIIIRSAGENASKSTTKREISYDDTLMD